MNGKQIFGLIFTSVLTNAIQPNKQTGWMRNWKFDSRWHLSKSRNNLAHKEHHNFCTLCMFSNSHSDFCICHCLYQTTSKTWVQRQVSRFQIANFNIGYGHLKCINLVNFSFKWNSLPHLIFVLNIHQAFRCPKVSKYNFVPSHIYMWMLNVHATVIHYLLFVCLE